MLTEWQDLNLLIITYKNLTRLSRLNHSNPRATNSMYYFVAEPSHPCPTYLRQWTLTTIR